MVFYREVFDCQVVVFSVIGEALIEISIFLPSDVIRISSPKDLVLFSSS
jgi:hypothetical protein